jgi:prephenate dehydrogenase
MLFDSVCIVGVGLIGGSFGLALRERGLARHVIGIERSEAAGQAACERGAVGEATTDLERAARGADLVFLAPPVGQMETVCKQLAPIVRSDAIITDGGSTKAQIVEDATRIFEGLAQFVGGHPMAGSEKPGVEAARSDLFQDAVWVLTPTPKTPTPVVDKLRVLVKALGATPLQMDARTHDALVAVTSHMPHITASALVHLFTSACNETEVARQLTAGGWSDSTRVAASSPEMWRDICLANAPALTVEIDGLIEQLQLVRTLLAKNDSEALLEWFDSAAIVRRQQGYRLRKPS